MSQKTTLVYNSKLQVIKGDSLTNKRKSTKVDIYVSYTSIWKIVQKEMLIYDNLGVISQLGGVISLFIGISFFGLICDVLDFVKNRI